MTASRSGPGDASAHTAGSVLFLLNSLAVGGSERKVLLLANALRQRGSAVRVARLGGPDTLRALLDPRIPVLDLHRRGRYSPRAVLRLRRHLRRHPTDWIAAVNLHPLLYALPAARLNRCRTGVVALVNSSTHRSARDRQFMRLYAPMLRRVDRVVFGSSAQGAAWIGDHRLDPARCVSVLNGVDADRFTPGDPAVAASVRASLGFGPDDYVVGSVGALRPEKAFHHLFAVARALRDAGISVRVLLVGDGPCRDQLERCTGESGLEGRVVLHGEAADVRPLLRAMDVFVLPSVSVETFSNAALEAMACARAVVLSDIGGAREMLVPERSGLIYPPGDLQALAAALRRLHGDPALRQAMGQAARRRVVERFSFRRMVVDYERDVFGWVTGPICSDDRAVADLDPPLRSAGADRLPGAWRGR
jgi:glycosyltransferase involved in cell wall biosynthesis